MDRAKKRKISLIAACVILLAGVFLRYEYEKHQEKPLLRIIPVSQDEIAEIRLSYLYGDDVKLDSQQTAEFWDALEGCTVKFWSADTRFPNFYASTFLSGDYLSSRIRDIDLSFSSDGHIRVQALPNGRATAYEFVEGGDAIYQFLHKMQWQE